MPQLTINHKPNGQHLRITVEQKPQPILPLIELQHTILAALPEFTPKDPAYIHLTLLHLGIPKDIYYEFRRLQPDLTYESFMDSFMELLQELHLHSLHTREEIEVQAKHLNLYGSAKSPAVALSITRTPELDQMHNNVFELLVNYIKKNFGIDPMDFIATSRNFRHSPPAVFNPHITLGRIPARVDLLPVITTPIKLKVGQPYLAHVTVI